LKAFLSQKALCADPDGKVGFVVAKRSIPYRAAPFWSRLKTALMRESPGPFRKKTAKPADFC
jgi:hypothetical protein